MNAPAHDIAQDGSTVKHWWIYQGPGTLAQRMERLSGSLPPWRRFTGTEDPAYRPPSSGAAWEETRRRGLGYVPDDTETDAVNTALYLRRPLLVTGKPGVGKTTLAYSIATDLGLGPVLRWPITSRTAVRDGLYQYDAIGRLHDANLRQLAAERRSPSVRRAARPRGARPASSRAASVASYLRLGPLGTALLPQERPRVLLIDEIDKGDVDLPGDLLTLFEEGSFEIPELARAAVHHPQLRIGTQDTPAPDARVERGQVQCSAFPVVVMTSNGERDFPPPFLRRCIRLHIEPPGRGKLEQIVRRRLDVSPAEEPCADLIQEFLDRRADGDLATDQLLNAIQLRLSGAWADPDDHAGLLATAMQQLTGGPRQ
ncbi:MoxR family ATPase [Streptomyces hawaiiensis]|uniref:AAA family ATPase n=1 Tax=Streptomyces hawaiiensis TaxID=67305 RepID=UPI0031E0D303